MSPVSCVSSYLEEHKNPPWGGLFLLTSSKFLQKHAHNCTRPPPPNTPNHTRCQVAPPLEQFLRAI